MSTARWVRKILGPGYPKATEVEKLRMLEEAGKAVQKVIDERTVGK
jgi:hypothetical protein